MKRNIKGTLSVMCAMLFAMCISNATFAKEVEVNISVNDKVINFTKETGIPFADERERTFVPIRVVMEAMDVLVDWNQERKEAILKTDDVEVIVTLDSDIIKVNGEEVKSDVPAVGFEGRTYLPIRIVAESFGAKVDWDQETMTVLISKEQEESEEELEEIEDEVPEGIETEDFNAEVTGSNVNIRFSHSTGAQAEDERALLGMKFKATKVWRVGGENKWFAFDFDGNERWIYADYVKVLDWDDIEIEENKFSVPADGEILPPYEEGRLTRSAGRKVNHDGREETWYDFDMEHIYENLWGIKDENGYFKYPKEEYEAWIDEYGYKRFGPYAIVAANWEVNPFGTLVNSSAGTAIVGDTGGFVKTNPYGLDIATNWTSYSPDPLH